jgi:Amino acid kinase family
MHPPSLHLHPPPTTPLNHLHPLPTPLLLSLAPQILPMLRRGVRALAAPAVRLGAMGVRGGVVAGVRGMSGTGESVARVLAGVENLADAEDLTRWLREGRAGAQGRTVIIKVGGEVVDTGLDELADALSALRAAGASPIVVHGGGPQMNKEIERLGLKPRYEGGACGRGAAEGRAGRDGGGLRVFECRAPSDGRGDAGARGAGVRGGE